MTYTLHLLQAGGPLAAGNLLLLCFITAFVITLSFIPPIIALIEQYGWHDIPNHRKLHSVPVPTMGGIAIVAGLLAAALLWVPFTWNAAEISFGLSIMILFLVGLVDDRKDLAARYKFVLQAGLATIIALSGIRIESLNGLLGIYTLPLPLQYGLTILAITGITNAFNLIDGIDGLAGGLSFMSLVALGLLLRYDPDPVPSLLAFSLAGAILGFLYFNFNPARIFMGDTGSLVIGFVIAVLCIRLMQSGSPAGSLFQAPVFVLGIVIIPVFDTLRVFATRIRQGRSPFSADRNHIHHLLTDHGFGHGFTTRVICSVNGLLLLEAYWLQQVSQEWALLLLCATVLLFTFLLKNNALIFRRKKSLPFFEADRKAA